MNVRKAAVAGQFYEADASRLQAHVEELLDGPAVGFRGALRALIVPHAGYIYSGAVAATAYRHLQYDHDSIQRIALFGPAHRVALQGMALPSVDAFATPLGEIPLDRPVIKQLATMTDVCISDEAHREEHSLEVQLPFLQSVLGRFSLVPVVVGRSGPRAGDRCWPISR